MRSYEPLWNQLKQTGAAQIDYPRELHDRVLQGLRKESAADHGFRFICVEQGKYFEIEFTQFENLLMLTLKMIEGVRESFVISPEKIKKREGWRGKKEKRDPKPEHFEL